VVNRATIRALRILARAYPAEFRHQFADDMVQLAIDRQRHDHTSGWRILLDETYDMARAAPPQRWESTMSRILIISTLAAAAVTAAVVAKVMLVPLLVALIAGWIAFGHRGRPIAPTQPPHRWFRWLVGGVVAVATAVAIPLIDGGELNAVWWSAMALTGVAGITMVIASMLLAVNERGHRATPAPLS
jgi:hypothetical protein